MVLALVYIKIICIERSSYSSHDQCRHSVEWWSYVTMCGCGFTEHTPACCLTYKKLMLTHTYTHTHPCSLSLTFFLSNSLHDHSCSYRHSPFLFTKPLVIIWFIFLQLCYLLTMLDYVGACLVNSPLSIWVCQYFLLHVTILPGIFFYHDNSYIF